MKKIIKIASAIILCLIGIFIIISRTDSNVTLYNPNGETISVTQEEVTAKLEQGYYTKPVQLVYAPSGKTECIYTDEFEDYSNVGWFSEPPLSIYSPDGRQIYIEPSQLEEYLANGYYEEPMVTLYTADGNDFISVRQSEVGGYVMQGYLTEPPEREGMTELRDEILNIISGHKGSWGIYVQNMASNEYISINDKQYSGASLIKLFNMAAVYSRVHDGKLSMTEKVKDQLRQMITISSNAAFNALTKTLGNGSPSKGFDIENAHTASIGCTSTTHSSELVEYDGYKAFYKGHNRTSPRDCGRILSMIYKQKLVSPEASEEMLELLKAQTRRWKIPESLPAGTIVANKTGETSTVEADGAIVYSPGGDYVICIICNGNISGAGSIMHRISQATYTYFNP